MILSAPSAAEKILNSPPSLIDTILLWRRLRKADGLGTARFDEQSAGQGRPHRRAGPKTIDGIGLPNSRSDYALPGEWDVGRFMKPQKPQESIRSAGGPDEVRIPAAHHAFAGLGGHRRQLAGEHNPVAAPRRQECPPLQLFGQHLGLNRPRFR